MCAKVKITCPHCKKKDFTIEFKANRLQKIKGGETNMLMMQVGEQEWQQHLGIGIATQCKCGRSFFIHGLEQDLNNPIVEPVLRDGHMLPVYCSKCEYSFISPELTCPRCNHQY